MKVVFMGTPDFAIPTMERLNDITDLCLVVTQEDKKKGRGKKLLPSPVKKRAQELGLEIFQPFDINSKESIEKIKSQGADLFVVAAYGQILKEEILKIPKYYPINVHASLLPLLRGAAPITRAIIQGFEETGVTIMRMVKELDKGEMALQKKVEILDKNSFILENELAKVGADLIEDFINLLKENRVVFTPQDDSMATYASKITNETFNIDFSKPTREILNLIRGLDPEYGARTIYKDNTLKIFKAHPIDTKSEAANGTILDANKKLIIKTSDGAISVDELQIPGKKRMDIKSFLLGHSFDEQVKLGD